MVIDEASRWSMTSWLVASIVAASLAAVLAAGPARGQTVGKEVLDALNAEGRVRVLVALDLPQMQAPSLDQRQAIVQAQQGHVLSRMSAYDFDEARRFQSIPALAGTVSPQGLAMLLLDPNVIRIDLDAPGSGELQQSVPLIGAAALQNLYDLTGAGVTVAVLDSGVGLNHPDLADSVVAEQCFCSGSGGCCPGGGATRSGFGAARDDHDHGSHVTSIITGDGRVASVGVAPGSQIVAVKVLDRNNRFCCSSDVVAGLDWILANHPEVRVVNMSLGTFATFEGDCDEETAFTMSYARAIDALTENGVAVFAASGNAGLSNAMKAPACVANAISVGAVNKSRIVAAFSDSGPTLDLLAPGVSILAANRGSGLLRLTGTSMSTPHAAAVAALLIEEQPRLSPASLLRALTDTGTLVYDPRNGLSHPLVDAQAAFLSLEVCDDGVDNDEDGFTDVDDPDCPPARIDIRPRRLRNLVPPGRRGVIPVALFGFEDLDGSDVDTASLRFGPYGAPPRHDLDDPSVFATHLADVDGDGLLDLITHYPIAKTGIAPGDTEACLSATIGLETFRACDEVITLCRRRTSSRQNGFQLPFSRFEVCPNGRRR